LENRQGQQPLNYGRSILGAEVNVKSGDPIQGSRSRWGEFLNHAQGSSKEQTTEDGSRRQPFDLGRANLQANRVAIPQRRNPTSKSTREGFAAQNEGSIRQRSEESGSRQQLLDSSTSILGINQGRQSWRLHAYDAPDKSSPARSQQQTDRFPFRDRFSQDRPSQELGRGDLSSFSGNERSERQERGSTAVAAAPWNSAQKLFQSRENRPNHTTNVDTGNRSGLEALLQHVDGKEKPTSRSARSPTTDLPVRRNRMRDFVPLQSPKMNGATNPSQVFDTSNFSEGFIPETSISTAAPFLNESDDNVSKHRNDRYKARFQESQEQEGPRTRGRFQAQLEEPQVAQAKVEPRMEWKGSRRASSRRNNYDMEDPDEELLSGRGRKKNKSKANRKEVTPARIPIQLPEFISVENLATALRVRLENFINRMEEMGFERPRYDHVLDAETSSLVASEFNFEPTYNLEDQIQDLVARPVPEDVSSLPPRPPIVTIMGHVDHGKTTILDWLRKSSVVESEHGGITQHIGAFSVTMPGGKQITFLDTPGHAAFLDMRRRGANVTDIVILVVAADDSVKPQTLEAIKHATDAKVPIIVAINKVDKEDSNVDRVKQDLARHGVTVEDYGGEVQAIPVSGKFGKGMAELEEATVTLSELLDHRAEIDGPVEGWIIESKITTAGRVATVLVRRGTLRPGDIIVAGRTWARIRTLRNDAGELVDEAPPGTPVQIDGWRGDDPIAGWEVLQAEDEDQAKDVVELRQEREEFTKLASDTASINAIRADEAEARAKQLAWEAEQAWAKKRASRRPKDNAGWVEGKSSGGPKHVHFVIKADVSGSVEAVVNSVSAIGNNEVAANVIRSGVGVINESDIQHLAASGETGYLISFNQPVDGNASRLAEAAGVEILDHNIIYKVTDVVKEKLAAELPPAITQRVVGEADIGKVFEISVKKGKTKIAGCKISNGIISRDKKTRVLRGSKVLYDGKVSVSETPVMHDRLI
jgi:small GTP-binding protein